MRFVVSTPENDAIWNVEGSLPSSVAQTPLDDRHIREMMA
jgi:hypothetical protein